MNFTEEQLMAINESGKNIIVSAGAGSGKTAVLSERVLRILKEGTHVNELLILTFTNAAASEMKERIRKKIKKDKSLINELDLIDSAYITTFDSFALSILKKYHYLLNINPNVTVADESIISIEKNKYLDEIFEEYYNKKDKKFIKLITTFCTKDDNEIRKAIIDISNKLDLKLDKEEYLNNYINIYFDNNKVNNDLLEYEQLILSKINNIKNLIKELEQYAENSYIEKLNDSLANLLNINDYDEINLDMKIPALPKNSSDTVKEIKEEINSIIKELKELTIYNKEEIKNNILSTKDYVEVIIEIINKLDKKLNEFKFKYDLYTFNDIAHLSIKIVKENEDIKNELKNKFSEILIDEYQDTSDVQEEFINLISNDNVYMVGDIKQSIYRFRNANPYIFKDKYDLYSNNNGGIKIDLNKNFRSREEVLSNINLIFNDIMTDEKGGADYKKSHNMIFGNNSYEIEGKTNQNNNIEIFKYEDNKQYKKEEIEAFIICNDIENKIKNKYQIFDKDKKILRDITYNDFVILMDRTTDFDIYKEIFTYKNIPLVQIKDSKMNDEIDLVLIKNIIKLILKVKDNIIDTEYKYLFMSIVRSFLYNMNDNDIYNIITNDSYEDTDLIKKIKEILINIDNNTPSLLIDIILNKFDYYNRLLTINNIESSIIRINKIKEFAHNLEELGYNIDDYSNYLEDLIESKYDLKYSINDNSDGVKIMTIHKSKGLEYNICYYSGLYKSFNISDMKEKFTYFKDYGIITPYFNEGIGNTIYKTLMKEKYLKEEISEKIRLFYVALTRAKEKMILIEPNNISNSSTFRSFKDIIDYINLDSYCKVIEDNDINVTKKYKSFKNNDIFNIIPTKNIILDIKNITIDKDIVKENKYSKEQNKLINHHEKEKLNYGTKLHEIFELEDFKNPKNELVQRFIKHFDYNELMMANILKEYEFIYEDDMEYHGVIDLLIEYDNHIDIVDYKLKNTNDDAYLKQLNGYKNYIEKISNKHVNIYLYSILDDELKCLND